jgi:hypothetical protein
MDQEDPWLSGGQNRWGWTAAGGGSGRGRGVQDAPVVGLVGGRETYGGSEGLWWLGSSLWRWLASDPRRQQQVSGGARRRRNSTAGKQRRRGEHLQRRGMTYGIGDGRAQPSFLDSVLLSRKNISSFNLFDHV